MAVTVTLPGAAAAPTAETMLPQLGSCRQKQQRFWNPLGLNLRRPGDIGEYGPRQGGRWYMPMWHIAGRLLEAGEGELPVAPGVTAGVSPQIWDRSSGTSRSPASSAGFP